MSVSLMASCQKQDQREEERREGPEEMREGKERHGV